MGREERLRWASRQSTGDHLESPTGRVKSSRFTHAAVQAIEVWDANMAQVEGHVDEIGGIYQFVDRHT